MHQENTAAGPTSGDPGPALPRSYLFVPGNRPERLDKALASGADAVIVDLEDAVPAALKVRARESLAAWLSAARPVVVRVNAVDTPWFTDDLALCRRAGDAVSAVMLAKAESVDDLVAAFETASPGASRMPLIPLIESAAGFDRMREIAAAPGVERLAFGAIDFQLDLGMQGEFDDLIYFRSQIVLASRRAGIGAPIDSPSTAIDDAGGVVESEARAARRLGFAAKLCIHPRQVEPVNRSFSPTTDEIAWAERVIAAAQASQGAAVSLAGRMVDKPVILRAEAILRQRRAAATAAGTVA